MLLNFLYILFVPFLVVKSHIFPMLASGAVCLPHRWRVVCKISVAIVAKVFRHLGIYGSDFMLKYRNLCCASAVLTIT